MRLTCLPFLGPVRAGKLQFRIGLEAEEGTGIGEVCRKAGADPPAVASTATPRTAGRSTTAGCSGPAAASCSATATPPTRSWPVPRPVRHQSPRKRLPHRRPLPDRGRPARQAGGGPARCTPGQEPAAGHGPDCRRDPLRADHWDGLERFLDDGRIELDNNSVERAVRPIKLSRKNALSAGSDEGGANWAHVASLVETCKLNGVNPQACFAGG